jgi:putative addiction module component (TIGR02574 family)
MQYPTRTEIEQLSPEERLRLIEDVWDTLEAVPDALNLSEAHREILDQRHAELERNPDSTLSWEETVQRVRNRR